MFVCIRRRQVEEIICCSDTAGKINLDSDRRPSSLMPCLMLLPQAQEGQRQFYRNLNAWQVCNDTSATTLSVGNSRANDTQDRAVLSSTRGSPSPNPPQVPSISFDDLEEKSSSSVPKLVALSNRSRTGPPLVAHFMPWESDCLRTAPETEQTITLALLPYGR